MLDGEFLISSSFLFRSDGIYAQHSYSHFTRTLLITSKDPCFIKSLKQHKLVIHLSSASVSFVLTLTSSSRTMFDFDNSVNKNNDNRNWGNIGNNNGSPFANYPYQPASPCHPSWNPTPYRPRYPQYWNPPYRPRYPQYWPPPYSPPIQTIQVPQYIPIPYYSDPYMYDDDGDTGHCCNTVVSHHCHHNGGRRGSRRGLSSPFDFGYGGGLGQPLIGWIDD
jgi:hypothetical protein